MRWSPESLASVQDRRFVITGANSGIGFEAAKVLLAHGAHVIMACRSQTRMSAAKDKLRAHTQAGTLSEVILDLGDLKSVRAAAAAIHETHGTVDVLINNGGLMRTERGITADGFETMFGVNHLGPFVFTNALLPHVTDRVVFVASLAHNMGKMNFEDLQSERAFDGFKAYAQSKLANLLTAFLLDARLRAEGSNVRVLACHPGYAATAIGDNTGSGLMAKLTAYAPVLLAQGQEAGAWPTLYAATADVPGGSYWGPDRLFETRGKVGKARIAKHADLARAPVRQVAERLWSASEALTTPR